LERTVEINYSERMVCIRLAGFDAWPTTAVFELKGVRLSTNSFFLSTIQKKIHQDLMLVTKSRHTRNARRKRLTIRRLAIRSSALTKLTQILSPFPVSASASA
jgi:hypothetical protein